MGLQIVTELFLSLKKHLKALIFLMVWHFF